MFGYILVYKNDKKKYEIGKRYNKYIYYDKEFYDINYGYRDDELKILKIKIFHVAGMKYVDDFKIIKEVNYKEIEKIEEFDTFDLNLKKLLFVKTQNERIFNELMQFKKEVKGNYSRDLKKSIDKAIINSGNHAYIDRVKNLTKSAKIYLLQKIGRNKDIEKFIKSKDDDILSAIIKIGRPNDLNFFMNHQIDTYLKTQILKHGRKRDIEFYINAINPLFQNLIVLTGIDKYMDYVIENNFNNISKTYLIDIGRKKDLDFLIKTDTPDLLKKIIDKQYDDHLYLLQHHKDIRVSKEAKEIIDKCKLNFT